MTFESRISVTDKYPHFTNGGSEVQLDDVVYLMTGGIKGRTPDSGL